MGLNLEERVKERTTELEEKTAKLERLNKLFVGRELRMKELKERIKELEERRTRDEGRPSAEFGMQNAEWRTRNDRKMRNMKVRRGS